MGTDNNGLIGTTIELSWPVTQAMMDEFGRATGDNHPIHVDVDAARSMGFSGTIVPGTFMVGIMGNAATRFFLQTGRPGLSVGYDRTRFLKPVLVGQTLVVKYTIVAEDVASGKLSATVEVMDESGAAVAVATHISRIF